MLLANVRVKFAPFQDMTNSYSWVAQQEGQQDNMTDMEPVEALQKIVADRGVAVLAQPDLIEGLLHDYCPLHKPEIFLLTTSLREGMPQRLMAARSLTHREAVIGQVRERMQIDLGMQRERAQWTVNAWLAVLPLQAVAVPPAPVRATPVVNAGPALKPWQSKTEKIVLRVFGFVILPACVLFLLLGLVMGTWPSGRGFILMFWVFIASAIAMKKLARKK